MMRKQLQEKLDLPDRPRWGGRRAGAGRKPGPTPGLAHRSRPKFSSLPSHVTLKILPGLPSLRTLRMVREVERSFAHGCSRPGFRLVHYSLQSNHVHLIVEATTRDALGRGMMAIAGRLGRAINRVFQRSGRVFADRYHLHLLKTPREVHAALRYVLLNARRHATRLARRANNPRLDPASSARWFDGWRTRTRRWMVLDAPGKTETPPIARARTWLLKTGWRRYGLFDPADVPG